MRRDIRNSIRGFKRFSITQGLVVSTPSPHHHRHLDTSHAHLNPMLEGFADYERSVPQLAPLASRRLSCLAEPRADRAELTLAIGWLCEVPPPTRESGYSQFPPGSFRLGQR